MDEKNPAKLQIYAVEEVEPLAATCIVRCVGGVARPGQQFNIESSIGSPSEGVRVSLDWIERYGRRVNFVDAPNNARVQFRGDGTSLLGKGITIYSVE